MLGLIWVLVMVMCSGWVILFMLIFSVVVVLCRVMFIDLVVYFGSVVSSLWVLFSVILVLVLKCLVIVVLLYLVSGWYQIMVFLVIFFRVCMCLCRVIIIFFGVGLVVMFSFSFCSWQIRCGMIEVIFLVFRKCWLIQFSLVMFRCEVLELQFFMLNRLISFWWLNSFWLLCDQFRWVRQFSSVFGRQLVFLYCIMLVVLVCLDSLVFCLFRIIGMWLNFGIGVLMFLYRLIWCGVLLMWLLSWMILVMFMFQLFIIIVKLQVGQLFGWKMIMLFSLLLVILMWFLIRLLNIIVFFSGFLKWMMWFGLFWQGRFRLCVVLLQCGFFCLVMVVLCMVFSFLWVLQVQYVLFLVISCLVIFW